MCKVLAKDRGVLIVFRGGVVCFASLNGLHSGQVMLQPKVHSYEVLGLTFAQELV